VNDRGEDLFRFTLAACGHDDDTIDECWHARTTQGSRDKFRRLLRYYDEGLEALNIHPISINSTSKAESAMLQVGRWLANKRPKPLLPSVIENVAGAVGVMYGYNTNWKRLKESRPLRAMVRRLKWQRPKIVRPLTLPVPIVKVWRYIRSQLPSHEKERKVLVRVCVCQARLLGRLRYTELAQLDAEETDPTPSGWYFIVRLKGHPDLTEICIPRLREQALDPVLHLLELRNRLRAERARHGSNETSFWVRENGKAMSTPELRRAGAEIMQAAGTRDTRGYLMKASMMTALREAGMLADDLAMYSRHKPGSNTYTRYVDWSKTLKAGIGKVLELQ
jgi:hypothetical protein